jgi:hypothetical protein
MLKWEWCRCSFVYSQLREYVSVGNACLLYQFTGKFIIPLFIIDKSSES